MATKEEYECGQTALINSRYKISNALNDWDFEKNGHITQENLSKVIPMGLKTVKRHYNDFFKQIELIYEKELLRMENLKKE
jgi:hypothetical protein